MFERRARSALPLFCLCALATLPACPDRSVADLPLDPVGEQLVRFPLGINRNLDLLFVVDDSNSMGREQDQMAEHFRRMIDVLDQLPEGRPNLHIGVVSTDIGAAAGCREPAVPPGQLRNAPNPSNDPDLAGCRAPSDRYLIDVFDESKGARTINYERSLGEAFACIATLGTGGCGFEAPLEAMRRALAPENLANTGFLREDSLLAVVFLTDEDDCSAADPRMFGREQTIDGHSLGAPGNFRCFSQGVTCDGGRPASEIGPRTACKPREESPFLRDIEEYVAELEEVRPDPKRLIVAGIMGAPDVAVDRDGNGNPALAPSCILPGSNPGDDDDSETAYPPVRTDAFLAAFPQRVRTQICADDLAPAIEEIGRYIALNLPDRCLTGALHDLDPVMPGVQPDCVITETVAPASRESITTRLPACGPSSDPTQGCWRLEVEPVLCADEPTHLEVAIDYPPGVTRGSDTVIDVRCLSE